MDAGTLTSNRLRIKREAVLINDAMLPILGLGKRLHPELDAIFVSSLDKTGARFPPVGELSRYWEEMNANLLSQFATLSANEWLQRHYATSEEDYAKDPIRTDWLFC